MTQLTTLVPQQTAGNELCFLTDGEDAAQLRASEGGTANVSTVAFQSVSGRRKVEKC